MQPYNRGINHDGTYNKQWRSTRSIQPYLLKNSPRSTLLLLLRVAGAEKVNDLYIGLIVVFYNSRGLVFIPGPYA